MAQTITVHVRADSEAVCKAIVAALGNLKQSPAMRPALMRAGFALLGRIRRAFIAKARGGTDEAGDRWQPLSAKTLAYGRRGAGGRSRAEQKRSARPSQSLTAKQQTRWWDLYRQGLAIFKGNKASAAKRAWAISKGEGAQTLISKYGTQQAEILRSTGALLASLSPGAGHPNQIFHAGQGVVTIGTNRKGASAHHNGVPGRLPQRRLWPDPKKWPASWWKDITDQVRQGVVDAIVQAVKGA